MVGWLVYKEFLKINAGHGKVEYFVKFCECTKQNTWDYP
jgi:hypothetical protein